MPVIALIEGTRLVTWSKGKDKMLFSTAVEEFWQMNHWIVTTSSQTVALLQAATHSAINCTLIKCSIEHKQWNGWLSEITVMSWHEWLYALGRHFNVGTWCSLSNIQALSLIQYAIKHNTKCWSDYISKWHDIKQHFTVELGYEIVYSWNLTSGSNVTNAGNLWHNLHYGDKMGVHINYNQPYISMSSSYNS